MHFLLLVILAGSISESLAYRYPRPPVKFPPPPSKYPRPPDEYPRPPAANPRPPGPLMTCDNEKAVVDSQGNGKNPRVVYVAQIPALKEFTIASWIKIYNYSSPQTYLSYSVPGSANEIMARVPHDGRSTHFQLTIAGRQIYSTSFPLRLNRWYHFLQAWNGNTGQWSLYVDGRFVAEGIDAQSRGYTIRGGGTLITGQEQGQSGNLFTNGMRGEVTSFTLVDKDVGRDGDALAKQLFNCNVQELPRGAIISLRSTTKTVLDDAKIECAKSTCADF